MSIKHTRLYLSLSYYPVESLLGTRTCCYILSPFQYFKELFSLVLFPLCFEAKADAKIITFITPLQIFSHLFSNFFSELPFQSGWRLCQRCFTDTIAILIESGCKFTDFFVTSKFFVKNFWKFFFVFYFLHALKELVQY